MLARKTALSTALAVSASLVFSLAPVAVPAVADEVTPPAVTEQVVQAAIAKGIRHLWMQPGAESAKAIVAAKVRTRTRDEWEAFAREHDCCLEPVLGPDELASLGGDPLEGAHWLHLTSGSVLGEPLASTAMLLPR